MTHVFFYSIPPAGMVRQLSETRSFEVRASGADFASAAAVASRKASEIAEGQPVLRLGHIPVPELRIVLSGAQIKAIYCAGECPVPGVVVSDMDYEVDPDAAAGSLQLRMESEGFKRIPFTIADEEIPTS